jgi:hypothetical protein
MRLVPPEHATGGIKCAITGKTKDPEGFIRTGQTLPGWDQTVDFSIAGAKEMARMIGWYSPEDVNDIKDRVAYLEAEFSAALEQLDKLTQLRQLEDELTEELA